MQGLYLTLVVQALIPTLYTTLRIYLLGDIPEVGSSYLATPSGPTFGGHTRGRILKPNITLRIYLLGDIPEEGSAYLTTPSGPTLWGTYQRKALHT